ncbi:hypothetical protein AVEN_127759-1 [Araneus ventricosus]|uniref:Uncharacterized protein n=1 Tax=Araneus ventricosus TaxID=182803 RepID=A0A4Y2ECI7_ARAVE|nr:hypothetical protein AVEN_127759-1 [Araneus ventricosus]
MFTDLAKLNMAAKIKGSPCNVKYVSEADDFFRMSYATICSSTRRMDDLLLPFKLLMDGFHRVHLQRRLIAARIVMGEGLRASLWAAQKFVCISRGAG